MDYVQRVAMTVLISVVLVIVLTAVFRFFAVRPLMYQPYVYFLVGMVAVSFVLPPEPQTLLTL